MTLASNDDKIKIITDNFNGQFKKMENSIKQLQNK